MSVAKEADKVASRKVGKLTLLDGALIGASKLSTELFMAKMPFIGNGSMRSGFVKVGLAVGTSMLFNNNSTIGKASQIVSTGVLLDGMEDLALVLRSKYANRGAVDAQTGEVPAFS